MRAVLAALWAVPLAEVDALLNINVRSVILASAAAILIGFVPPSQFENGSDAAYIGVILAGTVLLGLLPPWLFLKFQKPSWKQEVES